MAIGAAICGLIIVCGKMSAAWTRLRKSNRAASCIPRIWPAGQNFLNSGSRPGDIIVQANVEDTRLGVPEYVIEKLGWSFSR